MEEVNLELSDDVQAAIADLTVELTKGRELLEAGLATIKEGAAVLDAAGVKGTLTMTIEIGADPKPETDDT